MSARINRKYASSMDELIKQYINEMKISAGLNTQRVFEAWDECSGASAYTLGRFYKDGKLFINLSSSMVRSQMEFQKDIMKKKINDWLLKDDLFVRDDPRTGLVKEIILK